MTWFSEEKIRTIAETAKEVFGENVRVWLFGSRTDLNKRGGDIDLYVEMDAGVDALRGKLKFLVELEEKMGEQKIDVIIKPFDSDTRIAQLLKGQG